MLEYAIGDGYSSLDAEAWRNTLDGYAVASGLTPSAGSTGLEVDIASGTATVGETSGSVDTATLGSSTTVTLSAADPSNPRKDTVYLDTGGTVQVEAGTPDPAEPSGQTQFDTFVPEPPHPSTDGVILAEVWVGAGASSLSSADVRDRRVPADVVADRVVSRSATHESLDTDSATIGSTPEGRPFTTNSSPTLNAETYSGTQDLAEAIPKYPRHQIDIEVPSGGISYDILIPPTFGGNQRALGTATESAAPINITGSQSGPPAAGNYQVPSIYTENVPGKLGVAPTGVEITSTNPFDNENAGMAFYYANGYVNDCTFSGGTDGVLSYGSNVGVENTDFGATVLSGDALVVKHWGVLWEQKGADGPASGTVSGYAFDPQLGFIITDLNNSTLSGSSGQTRSGSDRMGFVWSGNPNRMLMSFGVNSSIDLTNDSGLANRASNNANNRVDLRRLEVGNASTIQLLDSADIPGGTVVVTNYSLGNAAFFALNEGTSVSKIGGSSNMTTTEDNGGTTNVYWSGTNNRFELQNNTAALRPYGITRIS